MERAVYKVLPHRKLVAGAACHEPDEVRKVAVDSAAVEVMTDLRRVSAATIGPQATVAQANQAMIARGVRLLLVKAPDGEVLGLITARDTMGEKPIKMLQQNGGRHGDLLVKDLMVSRTDMDVIEYADVLRAEVGHVIATLKDFGRQHALVVDKDPLTGDEAIRGIFSATQVGRQLGVSLQTFEVAHTFAEIEAALAA